MNELALVAMLRRLPGVEGIGDDSAVLPFTRTRDLLVTTDQFLEDVHFLRNAQSPADCGWKALARGLSDIAAMGGTPRYCFVSVALGDWADQAWLRRFYTGLTRLSRSCGVAVAGGDLSRAARTYCDVTVLGHCARGKALLRSGARAGDLIYVTGRLGGGSVGLHAASGPARRKFLRPEPRLDAGRALARIATAAMDLSDGLSLDLHRLCLESRLAAEIDAPIPVFAGASLEQALHGGDDYELLFTAPPRRALPSQIAGVPVTRVGRTLTGTPGLVMFGSRPLRPAGWDSFARP